MAKGTFRILARVWEEGLAGARGADQQDVALLQLHIGVAAEVDALVVVVNRHSQRHLGVVLTNDVGIHEVFHLHGGGQSFRHCIIKLVLVMEQLLACIHAVRADVGSVTGDDPRDLISRSAAEAATNRGLGSIGHNPAPAFSGCR